MGKKPSKPGGATPLHPHLLDLAPYPPGKPIEEAKRELGLKRVIKLASNENPLGPSPRALAAMRRVAREMSLYPDGGGHALKEALARKLSVSPEEIVLGNGSDEITLFLALCYLGPGRSIVVSDRAFIRYRMAAQLAGARARVVPMADFRHDVAALAKAVDRTTAILFLDNPCNPTGAMATRAEMERLLRAVPPRVLILVDEAYYEYAAADPEYPDSLAMRREHPNMVVARTFSKAYGLAGLRIGYALARPEIARDLDRVRPPFNTSRMAQAAAVAALGDAAHLRRSVACNGRGMRLLGRELEKMGLGFAPSRANFILVDVGARGRAGGEVYQALLRMGVIVRPMDGYGLRGHIRVSVGTPPQNRAFLSALRKALD